MNKMKALNKRLVKDAVVVVIILAVITGVMLFTSTLVTKAEEKKTQAAAAQAQDASQLAAIRSQLDRSGEAEKRFLEIQLMRNNVDFSSSTDALKTWARDAKQRYRFANNFKLSLPPEKPTDKQELIGIEYDITVREGISMELEAISDVHVYSFIEELERTPPGLVRLSYLQLERKGDMSAQTYAQMVGGVAPPLVSATMQFNWIGINPKRVVPGAAQLTPAAPAPASMP